MPPRPSALGALASRRQRAVTPPQDLWDVDQLLADSKELLGELPTNPDATSSILADMDAGEVRRARAPRVPKVGVVGAVADSAALPIRVASGFLGPGAAIGEGIAQGLESIAYLDGKPMPAGLGESILSDATRAVGKTAVAGVFGKLGAMNPLTSKLGEAAVTAAPAATGGAVRSLAQRLAGNAPARIAQRTNAMGNPARAVIGAGAGAIEGALPNVGQGAFTRAFDAMDPSAAFDRDAMMLDAGLGIGLGGPMGALMALRRGPRPTGLGLRGPAPTPEGPSSHWPKQPDAAPWQPETDQAFADQGSGWMNETRVTPTPQPPTPIVRGPAPRQRTQPEETVSGPTSTNVNPQRLLPGPGETSGLYDMPPAPPPPPGPEVGTQAVTPPVQGSPRFDVLDPGNTYRGPADPTGMPPGVPPVRPIPPTPAAPAYASPAGPGVPQYDAPIGPDELQRAMLEPSLPQGRFPAGDPTADVAQPFVPPDAPAGASNPTRDAFFEAMLEEPPAPPPVEAPQGQMVMQPFERPIPPAIARGMSNPMFGTPERVRFDGDQVEVFYQGRPTPIRMSPEQFADFSPELSASAPRGPKVIAPPSHLDDPVMADLLGQVRQERAGPPPPPAAAAAVPKALPEPPPAPTPAQADPFDGDEAVDMDEIERLLRQADEQDAAAVPEALPEPQVEFVDPETATTQNNASGDSSASVEAMNRQAAMKAKGESFVMLDRAGRETPLIGTDAVDQAAPKGFTKAKKLADGSYQILEANGGKVPAAQAPKANDLDSIVLEDTPTPPVKAEDVFDIPFEEPVVAPEAPVAATPANLPEAEGITLSEGDTPGTINQAGKFTALGDDWHAHDPARNKNLVIRKADGTYQVVKNNGGKTPKTWSKDLAAVREQEVAARKAKEEERQAGIAARKAERAAAEEAKAREAAGEPPEPVVAAPEQPVAPAATEPQAGPTAAPKITRDSFTTKDGVTKDAVDVAFERAPNDSVREALKGYGFRYIAWKQKWSFAIPPGSKLTQDEVDSAVQAILRGENPDSVQQQINADSLTSKAAAQADAEGRWAPPADKEVLFDRDLDPDSVVRGELRNVLISQGWKPGKEGNRRTWTRPKSGMAGDLAAPRSGPEAPPANPPQAEPPAARSATAASATTTPTTTTPSGTGSADEIRISARDVKVDPDAYQFKTAIDSRGRTEKLKGVGSWREQTNKLNRVLLHERLDGSVYVVDGHQRVGLAQDLLAQGKDVPDLHAVVLRESEGVTVEDARRAGAMENLVGGTTDPVDVARVMRSGDLSPEEQAQVGKIQAESGERFRQGRDLAKLEAGAFDYLLQTGDSIEPRYARLVSQYQGEDLQVALLRALERAQPQNVSAAKSILAKAADLKTTTKQPGIFEDMPEVSDVDVEALVKYEQKILGIFKKNRRLFGKSADNAAFLEQAGETKIDREAMAGISTEAQKAEFLFDKYVNAANSQTKQAIQETFDAVESGKLSLGAAADRVAKALEADFTGRPASGPEGTGAAPEGPGGSDGPDLFADPNPTGGLYDNGAVAAGRADDTIDDAADDVLDFAKRAFKNLLEDESGSLNVGDGLAGLEELYKRNPSAVFAGMRMAGGALWGAATADEDGASILDDMVLGAALGYGAGKVPKLAKALKAKAPELYKGLKETIENGRIAGRGEWKGVPVVRKPEVKGEDISGVAMKFWSPDKVVPDLWKHIEPIMADIRAIDDGTAKTVFEPRLARHAKMDEALMALTADAAKSRTKGHHRRVQYVEALIDELRNKPTWIEKQVSDATGGKITPKTVRKVNAIATNAIYHNLLGWAVDSGLANMTQALMNIPQIGVKSTLRGIKQGWSKQGRKDLAFLNVKRPVGQDEERLFPGWLEKYLDYSQKPMSWSDSGNRRATWAGAMDYATRQGMSKADSEDFARALVGQTQGTVGDLGSNPFHRHLGPLKVFTKYPTLWVSMLDDFGRHPDPRVQMRAFGMMTGIVAASAISGIEWMNFFWPRMGGLPGPAIALDLMAHATGGAEHDFEEHMQVGGTEDRVFPRAWNKNAAISARFREHGSAPRDIIGRKGQVLREVGAGEDLLSLFGIETANRAAARRDESEMYQFAEETRREEAIRSRRARREAGLALSQGDPSGARSALEALTQRQRRTFLREREMTPRERARRQTPTSRRREFDEQFQQEEQ